MTNLLATLIITTITNWTGYTAPDGKEAGIVCKQHTASIEYKGKTNSMVLLTEPTKKAVYREPYKVFVTNNWLTWYTNIVVTNLFTGPPDNGIYVPPMQQNIDPLDIFITNGVPMTMTNVWNWDGCLVTNSSPLLDRFNQDISNAIYHGIMRMWLTNFPNAWCDNIMTNRAL